MQRRTITRHRKAAIFLLATLQTAPVLALAGLATYDVTGMPRAATATMGAIEVFNATGELPAPTGLVITAIIDVG